MAHVIPSEEKFESGDGCLWYVMANELRIGLTPGRYYDEEDIFEAAGDGALHRLNIPNHERVWRYEGRKADLLLFDEGNGYWLVLTVDVPTGYDWEKTLRKIGAST